MSEVDETLTKADPFSASTEGGVRRSTDVLQSEALTAFARRDLWCFVELMFPVLYPGQKLDYAGYLEVIATTLMRVGQGKYRNVVINLPPRHMKSALASILYPAWRLGCDPTVKFIASLMATIWRTTCPPRPAKSCARRDISRFFQERCSIRAPSTTSAPPWADIATPQPSAAISPASAPTRSLSTIQSSPKTRYPSG